MELPTKKIGWDNIGSNSDITQNINIGPVL